MAGVVVGGALITRTGAASSLGDRGRSAIPMASPPVATFMSSLANADIYSSGRDCHTTMGYLKGWVLRTPTLVEDTTHMLTSPMLVGQCCNGDEIVKWGRKKVWQQAQRQGWYVSHPVLLDRGVHGSRDGAL